MDYDRQETLIGLSNNGVAVLAAGCFLVGLCAIAYIAWKLGSEQSRGQLKQACQQSVEARGELDEVRTQLEQARKQAHQASIARERAEGARSQLEQRHKQLMEERTQLEQRHKQLMEECRTLEAERAGRQLGAERGLLPAEAETELDRPIEQTSHPPEMVQEQNSHRAGQDFPPRSSAPGFAGLRDRSDSPEARTGPARDVLNAWREHWSTGSAVVHLLVKRLSQVPGVSQVTLLPSATLIAVEVESVWFVLPAQHDYYLVDDYFDSDLVAGRFPMVTGVHRLARVSGPTGQVVERGLVSIQPSLQ